VILETDDNELSYGIRKLSLKSVLLKNWEFTEKLTILIICFSSH